VIDWPTFVRSCRMRNPFIRPLQVTIIPRLLATI
jgi:hypothetical protein